MVVVHSQKILSLYTDRQLNNVLLPTLFTVVHRQYCSESEGSFPLIAKANLHVHCVNFHPITIFESTRCELASWLLRRVEKRLKSGATMLNIIVDNCEQYGQTSCSFSQEYLHHRNNRHSMRTPISSQETF